MNMSSEFEEEIKIEYYNSWSPDPLSENISKENVITNITNDAGLISGQDAKTKTNNNNTVNDTKTELVNWYKAIDHDGRYLCRFCNCKYSTVQTLRYHVRKKHVHEAEKLKVVIIKNKRRNKIKCHVCQAKFQCLSDLELHFKSMHETASLLRSCFYCNATFITDNELTVHQINVHKNIKKSSFVCSICGYRTSKKSHYNQHQNTHSSVKTHKCQVCDYVTNYLPNLKFHEKIHTNDKPYKCDYRNCTYQCVAKSALQSHQLKHYPLKNMLYCEKCSYKTVYKQSLKKHQDSHLRNSIGIKYM